MLAEGVECRPVANKPPHDGVRLDALVRWTDRIRKGCCWSFLIEGAGGSGMLSVDHFVVHPSKRHFAFVVNQLNDVLRLDFAV